MFFLQGKWKSARTLDGDFRRVRKVNSGTSQSDPKYNNHMLIPKEEFDDFAHDYDDCVSSDAPVSYL